MVDSPCADPATSQRSAPLIIPAMLVRRGKYSVADPLFVEERRNVYEALFASIGTSREFPRKVDEEADALARLEMGERTDLRHLPTVTIDGADAKDFDDAISVERSGDGFKLWVHIADVTHYVEPGSALDKQAAYRGNSVYLPGTVAPMLPGRLSNDVCSLRPHSDRAAVTVEMEVTGEGEAKSYRAFRSTIVSDARLTYEAVDLFLSG